MLIFGILTYFSFFVVHAEKCIEAIGMRSGAWRRRGHQTSHFLQGHQMEGSRGSKDQTSIQTQNCKILSSFMLFQNRSKSLTFFFFLIFVQKFILKLVIFFCNNSQTKFRHFLSIFFLFFIIISGSGF